MLRAVRFALLLVLVLPQLAQGQQFVIVQRNVNLRRDPSTARDPIMLLLPPEELELLDTARVNNYYRVFRAESGDGLGAEPQRAAGRHGGGAGPLPCRHNRR